MSCGEVFIIVQARSANRVDHVWRRDLIVIHAEDHQIRESAHDLAPQVQEYYARKFWPLLDLLECLFDAIQELIAQSGSLRFVSRFGFVEIGFGFRRDNDRQCHGLLRNRAFTSSHGAPAAGSSRCASSRACKSYFCASVRGTASGSAAKLSQSSSISEMRSSTLSRSIPRDFMVTDRLCYETRTKTKYAMGIPLPSVEISWIFAT
jgi:hypothetical protein